MAMDQHGAAPMQPERHPTGGPSGYGRLKQRPSPRDIDVLVGAQQNADPESDLLLQRMSRQPGALTGFSIFGFPGGK